VRNSFRTRYVADLRPYFAHPDDAQDALNNLHWSGRWYDADLLSTRYDEDGQRSYADHRAYRERNPRRFRDEQSAEIEYLCDGPRSRSCKRWCSNWLPRIMKWLFIALSVLTVCLMLSGDVSKPAEPEREECYPQNVSENPEIREPILALQEALQEFKASSLTAGVSRFLE